MAPGRGSRDHHVLQGAVGPAGRAPHVQAAIARSQGLGAAQPRSAPGGRMPVAPHVQAAIARAQGPAVQSKLSGHGPVLPPQRLLVPAPPAPLKIPAPGVIQCEPSIKTQETIQGIFRNWTYPIGGTSEKKGGGTGSYDVGASVYDDEDEEIGSGVYTSGESIHAEMAALNAALKNHTLGDVAKIRVTKGCCRRCAVVLKMLGLDGKVGPNTKSSTYSGAYKLPDRVKNALETQLTKFDIEDMTWVVEKGTWW